MTMDNKANGLIEVKVVYPSAHGPAVGSFAPETQIREIKTFSLNEFGLREETMDGNQIIFFLFNERTKIENLNQPLATFVLPPGDKAHFRLAKETIAG
jgi:hypothetical protein